MKITGNTVALRLDEAAWIDDPASRLHDAAPTIVQTVRLARLAFALDQEQVAPTVKEVIPGAIKAGGEFADPADELRFERDMTVVAQDPTHPDETLDDHVIDANLDSIQLTHLWDRARQSHDDALGVFAENPDDARNDLERRTIVDIQALAFTQMLVTGGIAAAIEQHFGENL